MKNKVPPYPWQAPQWQLFQQQLQQQKLPGAFLLHGMAGLGKRDFAQAIAARLLCEHPGEAACGQCRSCHLLQVQTHPDLFLVRRLEKSSVIKVEQIRQLCRALDQTAQRLGYQVAIIEQAHCLHAASANALLKTLEEPIGKVVFILLADQLQTLPATILSRCQQLNFSAPTNAATLAWLSEQLVAQEQTLDCGLWLKLANGAPLHVVNLIEADFLAIRKQVMLALAHLAKQEADVGTVATALLKRENTLIFRSLFLIINDFMKIKLKVDEEFIVNHDYATTLTKMSRYGSRQQLRQLLDQLGQMQRLLNSSMHPNVQLLLESVLIYWQRMFKKV